MSLRSRPRLLHAGRRGRNANGWLRRQRDWCDSPARVTGPADSQNPGHGEVHLSLGTYRQTDGNPRAEQFHKLNSCIPFSASLGISFIFERQQPSCHISNVKNSLSNQSKQRIKTTQHLPEHSPWYMDRQIHLTAMTCRPQCLHLELLILLSVSVLWVPFLYPQFICSFPVSTYPAALLPCGACTVLPSHSRWPGMCQGMARKADFFPSPKGPSMLHTVSRGLLDVRALRYRQAARHGSDGSLLVC